MKQINDLKQKLLVLLILLSPLNLFSQSTSDYDVVWNEYSKNSAESMPLGNGEVGVNLWVEENSDLIFYISRTDAYGEANRPLKIGRLRVSLAPNPFEEGVKFQQRQNITDGSIDITGGKEGEEVTFKIFMSRESNTIFVDYKSEIPREVKVKSEIWRTKEHIFKDIKQYNEGWTVWDMLDYTGDEKVAESADIVLNRKNRLVWYHDNQHSLFDFSVKHQHLQDKSSQFIDFISDRKFGAGVKGDKLVTESETVLASKGKLKKTTITIATHSMQTKSIKEWESKINEDLKNESSKRALAQSRAYWGEFWKRSYLFIDIPNDKDLAFKLTQTYMMQRYLSACGGRGNLPIKYNGSIFTTDPKYVDASKDYSPDYRNWGGPFWWQNTRLMYNAMFDTGDFDLFEPLFDFYLDRSNAMRAMANRFYNVDGLFMPETINIFGLFCNMDYGWDKKEEGNYIPSSKFIRWMWGTTLEFSRTMLDYYYYTNDQEFLTERALPFIKDAFIFLEQKFMKNGTFRIAGHSQSLETYWFNVENDLPTIAGLHGVIESLEALPESVKESADLSFYKAIQKSLPAIPKMATATGDIFTPAEVYLSQTCNAENPELYVVYPYGIANLTNDLKETGVRTFERRRYFSDWGWGQDGQIAAMLGLVDFAKSDIVNKLRYKHSNFKYPVMFGPNYDWLPDQCHGGNYMITMQKMLTQTYRGVTYLLPSWPKDWNVKFKVVLPDNNFVEGDYNNGELTYKKSNDSVKIEQLIN